MWFFQPRRLQSSWKTQGYKLAYLVPRNHLTSAHRGGYNGGSPQKFIYKISCFLFEGELSKFFQALYSLRYCALQVGCQSALQATLHKTNSVVQCGVFSPQSMHFPIVWCAVYIHFATCSLTTNLQSTIPAGRMDIKLGYFCIWDTVWEAVSGPQKLLE